MPLTKSGRNFMAGATVGEETTLFDEANAHIGVGDGDNEFDETQTDLQGENTFREGMDEDFPVREDNELTFRATFGEEDANFVWNEWGVFNADDGGVMLNRLVEFNGEKQPGQTWIFQVTLEIRIGVVEE